MYRLVITTRTRVLPFDSYLVFEETSGDCVFLGDIKRGGLEDIAEKSSPNVVEAVAEPRDPKPGTTTTIPIGKNVSTSNTPLLDNGSPELKDSTSNPPAIKKSKNKRKKKVAAASSPSCSESVEVIPNNSLLNTAAGSLSTPLNAQGGVSLSTVIPDSTTKIPESAKKKRTFQLATIPGSRRITAQGGDNYESKTPEGSPKNVKTQDSNSKVSTLAEGSAKVSENIVQGRTRLYRRTNVLPAGGKQSLMSHAAYTASLLAAQDAQSDINSQLLFQDGCTTIPDLLNLSSDGTSISNLGIISNLGVNPNFGNFHQSSSLLPLERSSTLFLLAVPSCFSFEDLAGFLSIEDCSLFEECRIIERENVTRNNNQWSDMCDDEESKYQAQNSSYSFESDIYSVIFFFESQLKADEFYRRNHGRLFFPDNVEKKPILQEFQSSCCYLIFVENVQYSNHYREEIRLENSPLLNSVRNISFTNKKPSRDSKARDAKWDSDHCFELPTCPYCLERLDVSVTGVVCHVRGWLSGFQWYELPDIVSCKSCANLVNGGSNFRCQVCPPDDEKCISPKKVGDIEKGNDNDIIKEQESVSAITESSQTVSPDLWLCLVCGFLGCGRYAPGQHSLMHHLATGHRFCMELKSGRIWDYLGDVFVHRRLVQCVSHHNANRKRKKMLSKEMDANALIDANGMSSDFPSNTTECPLNTTGNQNVTIETLNDPTSDNLHNNANGKRTNTAEKNRNGEDVHRIGDVKNTGRDANDAASDALNMSLPDVLCNPRVPDTIGDCVAESISREISIFPSSQNGNDVLVSNDVLLVSTTKQNSEDNKENKKPSGTMKTNGGNTNDNFLELMQMGISNNVDSAMAVELDLLLASNLEHQRTIYEGRCEELDEQKVRLKEDYCREIDLMEDEFQILNREFDQHVKKSAEFEKKILEMEKKLKQEREDVELLELAFKSQEIRNQKSQNMGEEEDEESDYVKSLRKEIDDLMMQLME